MTPTSSGKNIRIFLASGEPTGLRYAELGNVTAQAFVLPRSRFESLKDWDEAKRPGVYVLVGRSEETNDPQAYIGQSENVYRRLIEHMRTKDWWQEVYLVTSKDANISATHVRWMEPRLLSRAQSARRVHLQADQTPASRTLSRPEEAQLEEFLDHVLLLLGTLGCHIFTPLDATARSIAKAGETAVDTPSVAQPDHGNLYFSGRDFRATAIVSDEGFVVLKGSSLSKDVAAAAPTSTSSIRAHLKSTEGILETTDPNNALLLKHDQLFSSPSAAASFVAGSSRNGLDAWKTADGRTLKFINEERMQKLQEEPSNVSG